MVKTIPSKSCPRMTLWYRPLYQFHVQRRSLPKRSMTLLSMDKVSPARDCVAALFCKAGLRCSTACLIIQHSPPYAFFLLNGDIELNRNRQRFVSEILKKSHP